MTGSVAVFPSQQFLDTDGQPVANGTLTVYQANTLTLAQTWTDKDQTTLNTNPIILDALGEPPDSIWLLPGTFYDAVLKDQLGATVRTYNDVTGANSVPQTSSGEWVQYSGALTYVDSNTFTTPGNQVATFQRNRKILCYISPGLTVQGTIIAAVFVTVTTVTVRFPSIVTVLNAGLNRVDLSLITPLLSPIWEGDNISVDMTGYAGADIIPMPGATYTYTLSAVTTLLFRISTGSNQLYQIEYMPDYIAPATANSAIFLPNNTTTAAGAVTYSSIQSQNSTPVATGSTFNSFIFDVGQTPYGVSARVCTRTTGKTLMSSSFGASATPVEISGLIMNRWTNTAIIWTSLGTINWFNPTSGLMMVKRLL